MTRWSAICLLLLVCGAPALAGGDGIVQAVDPSAEAAPVDTGAVGEPRVRKPKTRAEGSVEIQAPIEAVWAYLSDNSKAREWSVYFHHISTIDALTRRCFVNADETGRRWDERVIGLRLHQVRHIDMYDVVGYKLPGSRGYHYDVWQLFERLGPNRTRLTFRTAPAPGSSMVQHMVWLTARKKTQAIFAQNLANIAAAIERGPAYERLFPYPFQD